MSRLRPLTLAFIKQEFLKEDYVVLDTNYINNSNPIKFVCPKGHVNTISYISWSAGHRCSKCARNAKLTIEDIRKAFSKEGYTLLSTTYVNARSNLYYTCPSGHQHSITWSNWNNKRKFRCPECSNRVSKQELEIQHFLIKLGIKFIPNCRTILVNPITGRSLELDFWFPDLNKAIEFNGEYWHYASERKKLDKLKLTLCKELGIDLKVVWYQDWVKNKQLQLQSIKEFLVGKRKGVNNGSKK